MQENPDCFLSPVIGAVAELDVPKSIARRTGDLRTQKRGDRTPGRPTGRGRNSGNQLGFKGCGKVQTV